MKFSLSFVAVLPLLVSVVALHGQEARGRATLQDDSRSEATIPARARANAVELVEVPSFSHGPDDSRCPSDVFACDRLDFAGKARYFASQSFGPGAFVGPFLWSAPILAKPPAHYPDDWRRGPGAVGRLYGDALAFQTAAQTGKFLAGAAFHEDPRYWPSPRRNPFGRAMHAVVFTAFDKSDSGRTTFAVSNFVASASAGFVGNAYLPHGYDNTSHAVTRIGIGFASLAIPNLAQEFTPEFRWLGKKLHLPGFMLPSTPDR